jgi:hypothetical protein
MMKPLSDRGSASIRQIRDALPRSSSRVHHDRDHDSGSRVEWRGAPVGRVRNPQVFAAAVSRAKVIDAHEGTV